MITNHFLKHNQTANHAGDLNALPFPLANRVSFSLVNGARGNPGESHQR